MTERPNGCLGGSNDPPCNIPPSEHCAVCNAVGEVPKLKSWWISWWHTESLGNFELNQPWWVSGSNDTASSVVAAIKAESVEDIKNIILNCYDSPPKTIHWRFIEDRPDDWSPFSKRFKRAPWMIWNGPV